MRNSRRAPADRGRRRCADGSDMFRRLVERTRVRLPTSASKSATIVAVTGTRLDERARLDALLVEYEGLLSDERSFATTLATLASVALALVAFIAAGALGSETVPVCTSPPGSTGTTSTCTYFRVFSPLAPLVVILYVEVIGVISAIRSFQLRLVEERIRDLLPKEEVTAPPAASYVTTLLGFTSLRRGARTFRFLYFAVLVILAMLIGGVVGFSIRQIEDDGWRHFGYAFYAVMGVLLAMPAVVWLARGPSLWRATYQGALERYGERSADVLATAERRLSAKAWAYLLLPRPTDLVKGLCAIGVGVFVYLAVGESVRAGGAGSALSRLLIAVFLFEVFAYQARYQLNDIRGLSSDAVHRQREKRRRLTVVADSVDAEAAVRLSLWVVLARLILFVGLGVVLLPPRATWITIGAAFAAFLVAIPYEWLRQRAAAGEARERTVISRLLYLYVGGGYVVRAILGALLVADEVPLGALALVAFAMLFFGGMFVTMTWALEGTAALNTSARRVEFDSSLEEKRHIEPLTLAAVAGRVVPAQPTYWRLLRTVSDRRFAFVWNLLLLAAVVSGVFAAMTLQADAPSARVALVATVAAVGTAWLLSAATTLVSMALVLTAFATVGIVGGLTGDGDWRAFAMAFGLLLAFFLTYVWFRNARYEDIVGFYAVADRLAAGLAGTPQLVRGAAAVILIGRPTMELLDRRRREHEPPVTVVASPPVPKARSDACAPTEDGRHRSANPPECTDADGQATRIYVKKADDAWQIIRLLEPASLVLDIEPLVCSWDTDDAELRAGLTRVLERCRQVPSLRTVVFATNSRRTPTVAPPSDLSVRYIAHARKPFARGALGPLERPIVVCGDQALTDGLLAWLLGSVFIHVAAPATAPRWVRLQSRLGRLVSPLFFSTPATKEARVD